MISYEAQKMIVIAGLILYFAAGVFERAEKHGAETYPFFSWYLFAEIPNPSNEAYTVHILSIGDTVYDPPLPFSETRPLFEQIRQSPTEYTHEIDELGRAVTRGHKKLAARYQAEFEKMFSGQPARYELVRISYDPVLDWKRREHASSTPIAVFDTYR